MKQIKWAIACLLIIMYLLYGIRESNTFCVDGQEEDLVSGIIKFEQQIVIPGEDIQVLTLGYPKNMTFSYQWYLDGKELENNTSVYTVKKEDLQSFLSVTVTPNSLEYEPKSLTIFLSELPVFYIDIEDGKEVTSKVEYINGNLHVQGSQRYAEKEYLYSGLMQIKGRGNTSWNNTDKKSFHLKLDENADLLGMGSENDWTMLANAFDGSLLRNAVAYELSEKLGLVSMSSTWVDVVINGEYRGNYQLCEKIEVSEERVDITNWEGLASDVAKALVKAGIVEEERGETLKTCLRSDMSWLSTREILFEDQILTVPFYIEIPERTGGVLMELDMYFDEISKFRIDNQQVMFNEPKYAMTNEELFQNTIAYFSAFYNAAFQSETFYTIYDGEAKHYSEFFDIDSLAAFYLVQEIFFNVDGNAKSSFFYKDVDSLAKMGPVWDMDWSSSGEGANSHLYDQWQTIYYSSYSQNNQWFKGLVKDPYFLSRAKYIWNMHRSDIFAIIETDGMIDQMYEYIYASGMINGQMYPHGLGFEKEVVIFREWMRNRLLWLDQQFASLETLVNSIGCFQYGLAVSLSYEDRSVVARCSERHTPDGRAVLYVDGMEIGEALLDRGVATWDLERNVSLKPESVIHVRVYNKNDRFLGSNYMDLRE